jgi:hypothetical protein
MIENLVYIRIANAMTYSTRAINYLKGAIELGRGADRDQLIIYARNVLRNALEEITPEEDKREDWLE